jgi:RNA polymerase sigma-70 factor (ECF subfamily)
MEDSQRRLLKRAMKGDASAFEELYRININRIIYHTHSFLDDKGAVEDVVQDIAVKLYQSIGGLKSPEAFASWQYRIIANTCYDYNMKHKAEKYAADIDDYAEELHDEYTDFIPEAALDYKDVNETVNRLIRSLPELQRRTLILYYYEDMNYRDIAKALNVTLSTVSTNLLRARKKLKEMLKKQNITSEHTGKHSRYGMGLVVSQAVGTEAGRTAASLPVEQILQSCYLKLQAAVAVTAKGAAVATSAASGTATTAAVSGVTAKVIIAVVSTVVVAGSGTALVHITNEANKAQIATITEVAVPAYEPVASVSFDGGDETGEHINPSSATLLQISNTGTNLGWRITDKKGHVVKAGKGAEVTGVFAALGKGTYELIWELEDKNGNTADVARKFIMTNR